MTQSDPAFRHPLRWIHTLRLVGVLLILLCAFPAQAEQSGPFASLMVDPSLDRYVAKSQIIGDSVSRGPTPCMR